MASTLQEKFIPRGSSIAARVFMAVGLPSALMVIALGSLAWFGAERAILQSLDRELKATVGIGAASINPLTPRLMVPDEGKTSRAYRNLVGRLKAIKSSTGSTRVTLVGADRLVRGDSEETLELFAEAPRVALDLTEFQRAMEGEPSVSTPFSSSDGRQFLSAYARIPERQSSSDLLVELGEPGGERQSFILVLEAPAAALDATRQVATYLSGIVLLLLVIVFALAVLIARTISKPLQALADGAVKLAGGDLNHRLSVPEGSKEVSLLGHTLEGMRKNLRSRDEERQMMLAGIAHEVRNPLGGMELFGGLLEEGLSEHESDAPLSAETRNELVSHVKRVRKELSYLTKVVNDFLSFAREKGVQRKETSISELLHGVAELKRREQHAEIVVEPDYADTFPLEGSRVKEALLNLVENALQATPKDGHVILYSRIDGDALRLGVKDTGKGMDEATREKIFQPFYTTKEKGSGLGLPLVAKFARDHGGSASVQSSPSGGTTVEMVLQRFGERNAHAALARDDSDPEEETLLGDE